MFLVSWCFSPFANYSGSIPEPVVQGLLSSVFLPTASSWQSAYRCEIKQTETAGCHRYVVTLSTGSGSVAGVSTACKKSCRGLHGECEEERRTGQATTTTSVPTLSRNQSFNNLETTRLHHNSTRASPTFI